jgi:hypothetical protein
MNYTDQQRAIIRRIKDISARYDAAMAADRAAHAAMNQDIFAELTATLERSKAIGALHRQYGVAYREFLNTL